VILLTQRHCLKNSELLLADTPPVKNTYSLRLKLSQGKILLRALLAAFGYYSGQIKSLQENAEPPWRILMYHRVVNPEEVPYPLQPGMYVRPVTFESQMKYLRTNCNVLPLDELAADIKAGSPLPPKTVAITFDDGWYDNYEHAFPVLQKYNLPATVFLPTMYIGADQFFWTDRVASSLYALWQSKTLAYEEVKQLVDDTEQIPELLIDIYKVLATEDWPQLVLAVNDYIEKQASLSIKDKESMMNVLTQLASSYVIQFPDRAFLTWDEVTEMAGHHISFGSHSDFHRLFTELDSKRRKKEVTDSIEKLRAHALTPSTVFCYPGGAYNTDCQQDLHDLGYEFALGSTQENLLSSIPILLGRIGIHEDMSSTIALFTIRIWGKH